MKVNPAVALRKGSACPPLLPGVLRLYSMRFCPFVQRTRLVLFHKKIKHETVNVNLKYKPDWLFIKNPYALVPILEKDHQIVYESTICSEYLEDAYPQHPIYPGDPYLKARARLFMEGFSKVVAAFSGMKSQNPDKKLKSFEILLESFKDYEHSLDNAFFGGSQPNVVDYHMWPWFERVPAMQQISGINIMPREEFPRLNQWMDRMWKTDAVRETMMSTDLHIEFLTSFSVRNPAYDAGLSAISKL